MKKTNQRCKHGLQVGQCGMCKGMSIKREYGSTAYIVDYHDQASVMKALDIGSDPDNVSEYEREMVDIDNDNQRLPEDEVDEIVDCYIDVTPD